MHTTPVTSIDQRPPKSRCGITAWVLSNRITHQLAKLCGQKIPVLLVAEHPRSGGTWLAHMLADYLQLPFPKYRPYPITFEAIIHTHLPYSPRLRRTVFVKRDGRDLVVSTYFYILKRLLPLSTNDSRRITIVRRYPSLVGASTELEDARRRMPRFIADWWKRPFGCRINWHDYSMPWLKGQHTMVSSYEVLRQNCTAELKRLVECISETPADEERLSQTIAKYSFEAQTGRRPGMEDAQSNKRKGIVGDWRNYFTREAAEEFNRLGGPALVAMGYEHNNAWVATCDSP